MYIELDHNLQPGKLSDINTKQELPTNKSWDRKLHDKSCSICGPRQTGWGKIVPMCVNKYDVQRGDIVQAARSHNRKILRVQSVNLKCGGENKAPVKDLGEMEAVAGTQLDDIYYDRDWGFFAAVLACYNNHWALRTSPDDWWNVIVRNVAQAIDYNGAKDKVRDFFVEHKDKKTITISMIGSIDYKWLFDQISQGIRENIKIPGYVDLMEADFSTTSSDQLISSQIMVMSSLQKYFTYGCAVSECGIPGIDMRGTLEDWKQLLEKTKGLATMLNTIINEIGLSSWFQQTEGMVQKLVDTFEKNPDRVWWSHILSWNEEYGSGARSHWSGWFIDFLMVGEAEEGPQDFKSGTVSVPLQMTNNIGSPVEDTGELVAGTFGYTVEEGERAPLVEAKQGWLLFLPKGSPVLARMKGH